MHEQYDRSTQEAPPQKYTKEDLKAMQAWPLERKMQLTHPK